MRTATDLFVEHAPPYMAKQSVKMARYYGSEALRNKRLQKNAINYELKKLTPVIQNVGSQALDQLSTKIRPTKKTDRKDLDGGSLMQALDLVKKGINLGQTISGTLFPQTKPMFKDYWSGDKARGAFNTMDRVFSSEFWKPSKDYFYLRKGPIDIYLPLKSGNKKGSHQRSRKKPI